MNNADCHEIYNSPRLTARELSINLVGEPLIRSAFKESMMPSRPPEASVTEGVLPYHHDVACAVGLPRTDLQSRRERLLLGTGPLANGRIHEDDHDPRAGVYQELADGQLERSPCGSLL